MTNDELEAVRARAAKATPGPWEADHGCAKGYGPAAWATVVAPDGKVLFDTINGGHVLLTDPDYEGEWRDETGDLNATFIAHARTDIPALLDEVERLRGDAHIQRNFWQMEDALARAEAHAERLSELLTRALWEIRSQSCDGAIYDEPLEDDIEQALSAYNQRTET